MAAELGQIKKLIVDKLKATDKLILTNLKSDIALINEIGHYIVGKEGKRIRPMLCLLVAAALDYKGKHDITMAAVVEFIHTSTLLHDDVVDESEQRRGKSTANNLWGNSASVLVGDFLYSKSFQLMVKPQNIAILELMATTTNTIAQGEVLQLFNVANIEVSFADYLKIINNKTAILFAASAVVPALLTDKKEFITPLYNYGLNLGIAFQIIDDILDYVGDSRNLGKNLGQDLKEGKITLPLIFAMKKLEQVSNKGDKNAFLVIKNAIGNVQFSDKNLKEVLEIIKSTNAINDSLKYAKKYSETAAANLNELPNNKFRQALLTLLEFNLKRQH